MSMRLDSEDPAVDELKRRARRRLVGAIVLALAAAVILPLLLESEPKPFGDDISIQIPPVDSGKFVSGLSPGQTAMDKAKSDGKPSSKAGSTTPVPGESTPAAVPPSRPNLAEAEQRVLGQPPSANPPATVRATTATQPPEWAFGAGAQAITFVRRLDATSYLEDGRSWYRESDSFDITPGQGTAKMDASVQDASTGNRSQ